MRRDHCEYLEPVLMLVLVLVFVIFCLFRKRPGKFLLVVGLPSKVAGHRPGHHFLTLHAAGHTPGGGCSPAGWRDNSQATTDFLCTHAAEYLGYGANRAIHTDLSRFNRMSSRGKPVANTDNHKTTLMNSAGAWGRHRSNTRQRWMDPVQHQRDRKNRLYRFTKKLKNVSCEYDRLNG